MTLWQGRWGRLLTGERSIALAVAIGFVAFRLGLLEVASRRIDPTSFGLFVTNRRWVATLQPLWMMGLALILIRWIAQERLTRGMFRRVTYLMSGTTAVAVVVAALLPTATTRLFFGAVPSDPLLPIALALGAGGIALYTLVQVSLQGLNRFHQMHAWQFSVGGLFPLLVVMFWPYPSATAFILLSLGLDWVLSLVALPTIYRHLPAGPAAGFSWRVGLPQVPSNFGLSLLLNAPTYLATQRLGIVAGGQFAVGTMVIGLVGNLFAAMSRRNVTLAAKMVANGRRTRLHRLAWRTARPALMLASVMLVMAWVGAAVAIRWDLLHPPAGLGLAAVLLSVGAIPYAVYVAMRGFVDGTSDLPLNAKSILWGWWVFLAASLGAIYSPSLLTVSLAGTLSLLALAGATYWQATGRRLPMPLPAAIARWCIPGRSLARRVGEAG